MNIKEIQSFFEDQADNLIDKCPHCWGKTHIKLLWKDFHEFRNGNIEYYLTYRCVPCEKILLKVYLVKNNPYHNEFYSLEWWKDKYPIILDDNINEGDLEHIPEDIVADYKEAVSCKSIWAYKASCSMFRRTLQRSLETLGAENNTDLIVQINSLENLTKELKDWAHQIRIFWNWWTHPDMDWLKEVNEEIANEVHNFLSQFLNYTFIMPRKVALSRIRRT